eukprot:588604-Pyramimonas_sp.AAC.1
MLASTCSADWISADRSAFILAFAAFSSAASGMFDISTITATKGSSVWPAVCWGPSSAGAVSSA